MIAPSFNFRCCVTSASKTGMCRYSIVKALQNAEFGEFARHLIDPALGLAVVGGPGPRVPELDAIAVPDDRNVTVELRVLAKTRRDADSARRVEFVLTSAGCEEPPHRAELLVEVAALGKLVQELRVVFRRVDVQALLEALCHDKTAGHTAPELGGQRETPLGVQRVLVLAEKHPSPFLAPAGPASDSGVVPR